MKFLSLPAKDSKDQPNIVKVKNRKLHPDNKDGDDFEIAAERFEYPQFESLDEFVTNAGSQDRALAIVNDHTADKAVASGTNYIRTATTGSPDDIVNAGIKRSKEFDWSKQETLTGAKAKEVVTQLRALDTSAMSKEDLEAALKKALGI